MKKLAFVLALCALLASCGANDVNTEPENNAAPEAPAVQESAQTSDNQPQSLDVGGTFIGSASLN